MYNIQTSTIKFMHLTEINKWFPIYVNDTLQVRVTSLITWKQRLYLSTCNTIRSCEVEETKPRPLTQGTCDVIVACKEPRGRFLL